MSPAGPGGMTVLFAPAGKRLTKSFEWSHAGWLKVSDYDPVARFTAAEHVVDDITGLYETVRLMIDQPTACIMRGALTDTARHRVTRDTRATINRCALPQGDGRSPDLIDVARQWIMVDVDDWLLPAGCGLDLTDQDDHHDIVRMVVADVLPPRFHGASVVFQWSSSCGLFARNVVKVHLFYWLTRPVTNADMRRIVAAVMPGVDAAPYKATQPHYVAAPVLIGAHDPIPARAGLMLGETDEVDLPELPPAPVWVPSAQSSAPVGADWLHRVIASLGDAPGRAGFHQPIRDGIWQYVSHVSGGRVSRRDAEFATLLSRAVLAAPRRPDRVDVSAYSNESTLLRSINQSFIKYQAINK